MSQLILRSLVLLGSKTRVWAPLNQCRCCIQLNNQLNFKQPERTYKTKEVENFTSKGGDVNPNVRPLREKIKETTMTTTYLAIMLAGVGFAGVILWSVFSELLSSSSPNSIYSGALERVKEDTRVQDSIGNPIKGYGEESRRRRRQHVAHTSFERQGVPHMRMQFYIQGLRNKATVHLESRQNSNGKMEYRYLYVQLNHYPHTTIILEDNRAYDPQPELTSSTDTWKSSQLQLASLEKK